MDSFLCCFLFESFFHFSRLPKRASKRYPQIRRKSDPRAPKMGGKWAPRGTCPKGPGPPRQRPETPRPGSGWIQAKTCRPEACQRPPEASGGLPGHARTRLGRPGPAQDWGPGPSGDLWEGGNPSSWIKGKRMQNMVQNGWSYRGFRPIFGPTWMGKTTRICIFLGF